jgi:hypothetical protein
MRYSRLIAFVVMVAIAAFPLSAKAVQGQDMKPMLIAAQKQIGGTVKASQLAVSKQIQIPSNIKNSLLTSRISLQSQERQNIDKATKLLVNQQFAALVQQSTSVKPDVTVLSRVGNKIRAEAFVVFRAKNTYTATISKLTYDIVGDKVTMTGKVDDYAPPMVALKKPVAVDSATIQIKTKLLADLKIALPQGYGPKAMANTPCTEFTSAKNATNSVYNTFVSAFGSAQKLLGSQSTKSTIMNVLQNGTRLLAWNNIGHGNPYCVVQWNDERIWNTDFNTTTRFKGIYNSVMLLNSCNVCKSPFALKNAIKQHQPRTYIGGSISLPVGRSELVDVDFWKYSLLQDKTMAWALNKASQDHGLAGAFCLDGFNGKFAVVEAAKFTEDCIPFNPSLVQAKKINNRWKVVQGSMWMLDFGSSQANANKAVKIIKHYKMDRQCFVGRPNAPMQYYTVGGKAPQGAFGGEDCIPFNPNNVQAKKINNHWKVVDGSHWILDFDKKEAEAKIAVKIIKYYGFKYICFVGRPNAPMMYFRK